MQPLSTQLVRRLRAGDQQAWYRLWHVFGPAIQSTIRRFGRQQFSWETVRDMTQETLGEAARQIDRFDPSRGVRFSTWLLSIARHVVCNEFDRRMAAKRGRGMSPAALDGVPEPADSQIASPSAEYEQAVFRAKVYHALQQVESRRTMAEFEAYRLRLTRRITARQIAETLGVSEPTVSRYLKRVREDLRQTIRQVVQEFSFTPAEEQELSTCGLDRADEEMFDEALASIYHQEARLRHQSLPEG
jgi:RNA polymerase sigma factor (sigma-70 family)